MYNIFFAWACTLLTAILVLWVNIYLMLTISLYANVFSFWFSKKSFFSKFIGAVFSVSFMFIICDLLDGYKIFGSCFLSLNIFNMLHYFFWNKVWRQLFLSHQGDLIFWLDTQMILLFLVMSISLRMYLDTSHSGLIFLGSSITSLFISGKFFLKVCFLNLSYF